MITTLTRRFLLHAAIVSALVCASGEVGAQSPSVQVIPQPKQFKVTQDVFPLSDVSVRLADAQSVDDSFATQDFINDLKATAGLTLTIGRHRSRRQILIGRVDL